MHPSVPIQASAEPTPAVPPRPRGSNCGRAVSSAPGVLATIEERVRFVRHRFGHYDLIDFVVVLLGYAISSERTLEAFYESVHPFAVSYMAR